MPSGARLTASSRRRSSEEADRVYYVVESGSLPLGEGSLDTAISPLSFAIGCPGGDVDPAGFVVVR